MMKIVVGKKEVGRKEEGIEGEEVNLMNPC